MMIKLCRNLGLAWPQKPGFYEYIGLMAVIVARNPVSQSLRVSSRRVRRLRKISRLAYRKSHSDAPYVISKQPYYKISVGFIC